MLQPGQAGLEQYENVIKKNVDDNDDDGDDGDVII